MAIVERIFTVYNDKGSKQAIKDLAKLEKQFVEGGKKIAKAFGIATVAVGAFAVKLGIDAVKGAMEDQKAQIALATALRNSVSATDEQIAATTQYLDALELQVGVNNDQLIPSLQRLVQATGDIQQAQSLQALALDISAGNTQDLVSVTNVLVRALGGNVDALKKLGVPLDESIIKNKDLNAALKVLATTFEGQASKRAETFEYRMERLKLQFDQTLDSLGYALIPVLENFATVVASDVLPKLEEFVSLNKDEIVKSLQNFATFAVKTVKALVSMFELISNNLTTFKVFTALLVGTFVGGKVAAGVMAVQAAIKLLTIAFRKQAVAGTAAGTATAFATGGTSALAAAAGIAAFAAAAGTAYYAINKLTSGVDDATTSFDKMGSTAAGHLKDLNRLAQDVALANSKNLVVTNKVAKKTQEQINLEKVLAKLKSKFGIVPTNEKDPIQLEAARLNLIRQGKVEEAAAVAEKQRLLAEQLKVNDAAMKYADILALLGDRKLSPDEIALLASKWGMSNDEVLNYLDNIFGIEAIDGGYDFSSSGKEAGSGWDAALIALNNYKAGLLTIPSPALPQIPPVVPSLPFIPPQITPEYDPRNDALIPGGNAGGFLGPRGFIPGSSSPTSITVNVNGTLVDTGGLKNAVVTAVTEAGFSGRSTKFNRGLIAE